MRRTHKIIFGCGVAAVVAGICAAGLGLHRRNKNSAAGEEPPDQAGDRTAGEKTAHGMGRARKIVFGCSIAVMTVGICVIVQELYRQERNFAIYEKLPNQVVAWTAAVRKPAEPPSVETPPAELPPDEPGPYASPIDFEALWKINSDIYAWIEIPGTNVAYPIVQHPTNDAYYLNRTIERKLGLPGSIYTEASVNKKDFSDFNTIVYGHNMRTKGTMFHDLVQYHDVDFMEKNGEIIIYTPDTEYHYRIFAAVTYGNAYIPYRYNGKIKSDRQAYLNSLASVRDRNSHVLADVEVTKDSHLLTLSTCVQNVSQRLDKRFLVVAVLLEDEASVEGAAK